MVVAKRGKSFIVANLFLNVSYFLFSYAARREVFSGVQAAKKSSLVTSSVPGISWFLLGSLLSP